MEVAVWDTYVQRKNGLVMHFDILVPSFGTTKKEVFEFGAQYLQDKDVVSTSLSTSECRLCHMEQAPEIVEKIIGEQGYFIIEMENCN